MKVHFRKQSWPERKKKRLEIFGNMSQTSLQSSSCWSLSMNKSDEQNSESSCKLWNLTVHLNFAES